jgi:dihydrofolate synthase/folylpolyglutamate synthase
MSKYEKCLKTLYEMNRYSKFKYNLDEVQKLSSLVGDPSKKFLSIHITGTNGKGSVTHLTSEVLRSNFNKKKELE